MKLLRWLCPFLFYAAPWDIPAGPYRFARRAGGVQRKVRAL